MDKIISNEDKAVFPTGTAAKLTNTKPKTIINYDNEDLIEAKRTDTNRRLFSKKDLFEILIINYLKKSEQLTFKSIRYILNIMEKTAKENIDLLKFIIPSRKIKEFQEQLSF